MTSVERPRVLHEQPGEAPNRVAELQRENDQLRVALQSRIVIEQAKGVLAERYGLPVGTAFELLRRASRSSQRRIHDLAADVVANEGTPAAVRTELERLGR